jgi:hypothetical protein
MLLNHVFINIPMATGNLMTIKDAVAKGLFIAVKKAEGKCVFIYPTRLLTLAGYSHAHKPRAKVATRNILTALCNCGLLEYMGTKSKRQVYCIREGTPLWDIIKKSNGPEDVLRFIEKLLT